jgi:ferredoxin
MVAASIMGWDPVNEVGTNHLAIQRGIGPRGMEEIEVVGEAIEDVVHPMKKPEGHQDGQMFIDIRMPILVDEDKCIACGICAKVCPAQVITIHKLPEFNMDRCIQCFCCVELCPHGALKAIRPDE